MSESGPIGRARGTPLRRSPMEQRGKPDEHERGERIEQVVSQVFHARAAQLLEGHGEPEQQVHHARQVPRRAANIGGGGVGEQAHTTAESQDDECAQAQAEKSMHVDGDEIPLRPRVIHETQGSNRDQANRDRPFAQGSKS